MNRLLIKGFYLVLTLGTAIYGCTTVPTPPPGDSAPPTGEALPRSPAKEAGRANMAMALASFEIVKDPEITSLVNRIGREIVSARGKDPATYHFFVVNEPSLNAFAISGGYIFFFTGLIEKMRSASELAGVLAHEIAHIERNHHFQDQGKMQAATLATLAAIILSGGDPAVVSAGMAANIELQLHYSRENETEADTYAIRYLRSAGYDPIGLARSFQTLSFYEQFNSPDTPSYFSTHPGLNERLTHLELALERDTQSYPVKHDQLYWYRILAGLRAKQQLLDAYPAMVRDIVGEENPEFLHYLTGVAYLKTGHYDKAVPEYEAAIRLNPVSGIYHGDLSLCYFHLNDPDSAQRELEAALQLDPNEVNALTVKGHLLNQAERYEEAVHTYKRALEVQPTSLRIHLQLVKSYAELGKEEMQAYYLGRFLRLDMKPSAAVKEFKRAQKLVTPESELGMEIALQLAEIKRDGI